MREGRGIGGLGEKDKGIKQKEKKILIAIDSMMIPRGKGELGKVEEGTRGTNGDVRRLDQWWWTHNRT